MYHIFEKLLKLHNTTPYKVSKATGIANSTLSDWKNGVSVPKQDKLLKIADYFNVSLEYLIGKTNNPSPINTNNNISNSIILSKFRYVNKGDEEEFMYSPEESADLIVDLLHNKSTSVDKMLKECGLKPRVISNMKSGSMPSADKLALISDYLGVSTDYLLGKTDNPNPINASNNISTSIVSQHMLKVNGKEFSMKFLDRIDSLIEERGITRNILSKEIKELNHNSFNAWQTRGTIPSGEIISKIADYFNVSTDYLLGKTDNPAPINTQKEHLTLPSDVQEFYDLLTNIGVKEPNKPLSEKTKERLFKLVENNANLIVENEDKAE